MSITSIHFTFTVHYLLPSITYSTNLHALIFLFVFLNEIIVAFTNISRYIGQDAKNQKELKQIKQRFLALNQIRYARTLAVLSDRQQQFLTLLPLP